MIQADGNAAVIKMYEALLAKAREGRIGYAYSVACEEGKNPLFADAGTTALQRQAGIITQQLAKDFQIIELNVTLPERDPKLDASWACYDVPNYPLSFDFICWLVEAELNRILAGAPAPLKVGFWFGRDGSTGLYPKWRAKMLNKVCRPALELIGAIETLETGGRSNNYCNMRPIVEAARAGARVPHLQAPNRERSKIKFDRAPITITLREAEHWSHRNSNLPAWLRFADFLKSKGENVIFVRDTVKADEQLPPYNVDPRSSRDILRRMALYQAAKLNFFTSNGPCLLAIFSDVPYVILNEVIPEDHIYQPQKASFVREFVGIDPLKDEQLPWQLPNQKTVWKSDRFENIIQSYDEISASGVLNAA